MPCQEFIHSSISKIEENYETEPWNDMGKTKSIIVSVIQVSGIIIHSFLLFFVGFNFFRYVLRL